MSRLFSWRRDKTRTDTRPDKTAERAAAALQEAGTAAQNSDIKAATRLFEESAAIYRSLGMRREEASAHHALGVALADDSAYTPAFESFDAAIRIYRDIALKPELAGALRDAGSAAAEYSNTRQANTQLEESLTLFKSLDDRLGIASTLMAMGRAAQVDEELDTAANLYGQSLAIYKETGSSARAALCLIYLSSIATHREEFHSAREQYLASIELFRIETGTSPMIDALSSLAVTPFTDESAGEITELLDAALSVYGLARQTSKEDLTGSTVARVTEASACLILAPVAFNQDRAPLGAVLLERAVSLTSDLADTTQTCHTLLQAGRICFQHNDYAAARNHYAAILDVASAPAQAYYRSWALYGLAQAAHKSDDTGAALKYCEDCLESFKQATDVGGTARAILQYGNIMIASGDVNTGLDLLKESLSLFQARNDGQTAAVALQNIGEAAREIDPDLARNCLNRCIESEDAHDNTIAYALESLAELDLLQGELASAYELSSRALQIRNDLEDRAGIADSLECCAHIATIWGDIETAVVLLSKSESIIKRLGASRKQRVQARFASNVAALREEMGSADFDKAWREAELLTTDEIAEEVALLLEDIEPEDEEEMD